MPVSIPYDDYMVNNNNNLSVKDTSLEISSLALKYLDESQLSKLADKHRGNKSRFLPTGHQE